MRAVSAMLEPTNTAIWIDKVSESLGLGEQYVEGVVEIKSTIDASPLTPMDIMEDNQAAIAWSSNPVLSQRMRHVERGLLHVRQMVLEKKIRLVWIETAN